MRKLYTILFFAFLYNTIQAQNVGIGTTTPHPSAMLDVQSTTKGMLVPSMSTSLRTAIVTPAKGLLVFDNDTNSFWYYNGTAWQNMAALLSGNTWSLIGNASTTAANFIGTTDNIDLNFKRNNLRAGLITFSNTSFGNSGLLNNTSGLANTAFGGTTLNDNTIGANNTAQGFAALFSNISGNNNTAVGVNSLLFNTTGYSNVAVGTDALFNNNNRNNLVAIGDSALYNNGLGATLSTHSIGNTAIGSKTLFSNTIGKNNTATGYQALLFNTSGASNTAVGFHSLRFNNTGTGNTAIGLQTLFTNTTGGLNTALGYQALLNNVSGFSNTATGYNSNSQNSTGNYNTSSGASSLTFNTTGNNNTAIGNNAILSNTSGYSNVAVGTDALYSNTTNSNLVAIGDSALFNNGIGATSINEAKENTAVGSKAMFENTKGFGNTANGFLSLKNNITGSYNTAMGRQALFLNTATSYNTAIGTNALYNNQGQRNTAVGMEALYYNITGSYNTAIGDGAGNGLPNNVSDVTCLGISSGFASTNSNSIILGDLNIVKIAGQVPFSTFSDGRIKNNIQENVQGLDFIKQLRPVTYNLDIIKQDAIANLRDTKKENNSSGSRLSRTIKTLDRNNPNYPEEFEIEKITQIGFIAQEVEAAAKKTKFNFSGVQAPKDGKGLYMLRYTDFIMPLVKAVQEQQVMIEDLKKENATLQIQATAQTLSLQLQIDALKKLMEGLIKK